MAETKIINTTPKQAPQPETPPVAGIFSLILGILSVFGFGIITALPSIILAIVALIRSKNYKWLSIVGIILSIIGILLTVIFVVLFGGLFWVVIEYIKAVTVQ